MYRYLRIIILALSIIILNAKPEARASALAYPPSATRMVIFNTVDGSALTSTPVTVAINTIASGKSQSITCMICNDAAADASGNSDLLVNFSGSAAATPTNGVAGSSTLRVFPGEKISIDTQATTCSMASRSTSINCRLFFGL